MKRSLTLLLFFLSCLAAPVLAQKGSGPLDPLVGIHQDLSLLRNTYRLNLSPTIGLQQKRHQVHVGPVLLLKEFPSSGSSKPELSGLAGSYRFSFTRREEAAFRFFIEYTSRYQHFEEEWEGNYWDVNSETYKDYEAGSQENLWENYVGLGFKSNLSEQLELHSSFAGGVYFSDLQTDPTNPRDLFSNTDYRPYGDVGISLMLGLGLTYQLK